MDHIRYIVIDELGFSFNYRGGLYFWMGIKMNTSVTMEICTVQAQGIKIAIIGAVLMIILMTILAYKQKQMIKEI